MSVNRFPPGWDEERVQRVLEHYESQTDEEAVAEDEERTRLEDYQRQAVAATMTIEEVINVRGHGEG